MTAGPLRLLVVDPLRGISSGGYAKYLLELLPVLHASLPAGSRLVLASRSSRPTRPHGVPVRAYRTRADLRQIVRDDQVQVVLVATARRLPRLGVTVVCMVRNMEPFDHPSSGHQPLLALKNQLRRRQALRGCAAASRVIAVSGHVRDVLKEHGVHAGKVRVVHHGVDMVASQEGAQPSAAPAGDFLFTAGSIRPARGLEDVVRAMPLLPPDLALVVGGTATLDAQRYERRMRALVGELGLDDRVHWAGQLDVRDMSWFFSRARAFITTSRAEACPNTLLEAMSHGCACVATDTPPMPEFLGEAGKLYEPGRPEALAVAVRHLLARPEEVARLGVLARSAVRDLSWETCAQRTLEVLRDALQDDTAAASASAPSKVGRAR